MLLEDAVVILLMKTFCYSAIQHEWAIWNVFFLNARKKMHCLCVCLCPVLSCDGTCPAPCCECPHWAVITHLTAVWNIHSQVSPSLRVSHMDSLLSPPSALAPRSLISTCLFLNPTHLSVFGCTSYSHPVLSHKLEMPLFLSLLFCFFYWLSDRVSDRVSRIHLCM